MASIIATGKKRSILKTYSRRSTERYREGLEPSAKRRCMETEPMTQSELLSSPSSSPQRAQDFTIFSDPLPEATTSPPTSPPTSPLRASSPLLEQAGLDSAKPYKPLLVASENSIRREAKSAQQKRLKQMQIDLGGPLRKTCKICGMEYAPSVKEDVKWHQNFHNWKSGGVDISSSARRQLFKRRIWIDTEREGMKEAAYIACVDATCSSAEKSKALEVLRVVETDLSAAPIAESCLWESLAKNSDLDLTTIAPRSSRKLAGKSTSSRGAPRYKIFLYIKRQKCIGFVLVEKIRSAFQVLPNLSKCDQSTTEASTEARSSAISTNHQDQPAILGISRIWTSSSHRRKRIAWNLLEASRRSFVYALNVPKESIAFSQPSASGGSLAKKWFGKDDGWLVYVE